jgi:SAM-dependent methyltransferase
MRAASPWTMLVVMNTPSISSKSDHPGDANGWDKWGDLYAEQWSPIMEWMCRAAGLAPGMRVLDLACGTGQPALPAAKKVRPGGMVVATDVDPTMLRATERRAREMALDNVEVREMNMHAIGFPDASFDAVTVGFALMFSPEPEKVASEIRRVLKPGGRFALCVWDVPAKTPFLTTVFGALAEVAPSPPPPPEAPGPFRLSQPGALESVLNAAAFRDVTIEPVPFTAESASVEDHFQMFYDMVLKSKVDALSDADRARLRERFASALSPYLVDGRVRISLTPLAASGCR